MFLNTKPTLLIRAHHSPWMLKETSVTAAKEQPRTIGKIESQTWIGYLSPRTEENITEKTGSADLITCVKETATLENETQAEMWPIVWNKAGPRSAKMKGFEIFGQGWSFKDQRTSIQIEPTKSWKEARSHGKEKMFNTFLL